MFRQIYGLFEVQRAAAFFAVTVFVAGIRLALTAKQQGDLPPAMPASPPLGEGGLTS